MTEPVDINEKRKAKAGKCQLCGKPQHEFSAMCPRVSAITEEEDGAITLHLYPLDDEPVAGA